jgi:hypothetical protein
MNWKKLFTNPVFVTVWTAVGGAISPQLYGMVQNGAITWDWTKWQAMLLTAGGAAFIALLHLYLPSPAPTSALGTPAPSGPLSGSGSTQKLGAIMLCAILVSGTLVQGCSAKTVAQDIVNWTPALQAAVTTVDSTIALLAPVDAPIFAAATVGFDAASNLLVGQAKAYLANPTASLLTLLQTQAVTFQQQVNAALLKAAGLKDVASQQHATAAINVVVTIITAITGLVASISSKAAVAQMARDSNIKLAAIAPYVDRNEAVWKVAAHYNISLVQAVVANQAAVAQMQQAGF